MSAKMTAEEWEEFQAWRAAKDTDADDDDTDDDTDDDQDDDDDADDDDDDVITYRGTRYRREDTGEDAPSKRRQSGARERGTRSQRTPRKNAPTGRSAGKPRTSKRSAGPPTPDPIPEGGAAKRRLFT